MRLISVTSLALQPVTREKECVWEIYFSIMNISSFNVETVSTVEPVLYELSTNNALKWFGAWHGSLSNS